MPDLVADLLGSGPAVVLLHGQPGSAADWRRAAPHLVSEFTLVVPDRPGYGRTGGRASGFEGNARRLARLLDRQRIDRAIVVGYSWAGGVALAMAETFPERVAGLVLAASIGPEEHFGWADRMLGAPVVGDVLAGLTIGLPGRVLGNQTVRQTVERHLRGQMLEAVTVISRLTGAGTDAPVWRSFVVEQRALLDELPGLGLGLGRVSVPVEVVNGDSDRIVPPSVGAGLARAIPEAARTVVPRAGHFLPHDHPEAVADAVRRVWGRASAL